MGKIRAALMLTILIWAGPVPAQIPIRRLPDLNIPRHRHFTLFINGQPTVFGGHTNAEYFADGEWHLIDMAYPHDDGMALPLSSGHVLLAGGHEKDLGIGLLHSVETYAPDSHTFDGFGCLDTKRAIFSATELDSGRVVISGNWYHDDGIEMFDGNTSFTFVKEVAQQRSRPYIFRTAPDDAVIFSRTGTRGEELDTIIVDRLRGEPFTPPLFRQYLPTRQHICFNSDQCRIDEHTYLFPVADSTGQVAIAVFSTNDSNSTDYSFSLLPTDHAVPMSDERGNAINWFSPVIADRQHERAYLVGCNDSLKCRDFSKSESASTIYVLTIVTSGTFPITLDYADLPENTGISVPVLTPDGNLLMTGGALDSNFHTYASALLLLVGNQDEQTAAENNPSALFRNKTTLWLTGIAALLIVIIMVIVRKRKRREHSAPTQEVPADSAAPSAPATPSASPVPAAPHDLMRHITEVMVEQKLYLNPDLKLSDVADRLSIHKNIVSSCINSQAGCSFSQFVNRHRVSHAQELLRLNPDMKISAVCDESGFSTESSFFRAFRAVCGTTPREWVESTCK